MEHDKPLTSVHEALTNAVHATKAEKSGKPISFRLEPEVKGRVIALCEAQGTTLSEFLRQCCLGLVSDYTDASRGG